jgi:hypothetical protein
VKETHENTTTNNNQTTNNKQQTTNNKQQTTNNKEKAFHYRKPETTIGKTPAEISNDSRSYVPMVHFLLFIAPC